jgi:hypothetical protein
MVSYTIKRIIGIIVTFAFIFTQCGLGFAAQDARLRQPSRVGCSQLEQIIGDRFQPKEYTTHRNLSLFFKISKIYAHPVRNS